VKGGTESKVRVLVEWSDHQRSWATIGISDNVIAASWHALVDALRLELIRLREKDDKPNELVEDYSWGV
jgi:2-isopropylmalate synthase